MTNELTPLEPDELDTLDDEADQSEGDAQPTELEALRAEVESLKQNHSAIEDLKRSVGRMQSLATKWETSSADERGQIAKQIEDRFSALDQQVESIVAGLDETALDPATRNRILSVRDQIRRDSELRQLVDQEVEKRVPRQTQNQQEPSPLEMELIRTITAAGLDPDSQMFDWKGEMSRLVVADPSGQSLRKHVLDKILESRADDDAATRRTAAKAKAPGSPKPNTVVADPSLRIKQSLDSNDFAAAYREQQALLNR